jgi:hypothetical protein
MLDMARRAFRIPPFNRANMKWYVAGGLALAGLYFILANKDTGFPLADQFLEPIGDITGLEGRGSEYLPQLFGGAPVAVPAAAPSIDTGYADWRFTNAYQTDSYDEFRFSGAYKNE